MGSRIVDIKESFLQSQIRALSQDFQPSPNWRGKNSSTDNDESHRDLRAKNVDEALRDLNAKLKVHNLLVYNGPSRRHIAEQIEKLYWDAGERGVNVAEEEWMERGVDYCVDKNIKQLPEAWEEEAQVQRAPEKARRYQEVQGRLAELSAKRKEASEKLRKYKALKELLQPFEEPKSNVQPNLITKDGDLVKELERMRILMARVSGRIQGLGDGNRRGGGGDEMDLDGPDEEEKLKRVMETM